MNNSSVSHHISLKIDQYSSSSSGRLSSVGCDADLVTDTSSCIPSLPRFALYSQSDSDDYDLAPFEKEEAPSTGRTLGGGGDDDKEERVSLEGEDVGTPEQVSCAECQGTISSFEQRCEFCRHPIHLSCLKGNQIACSPCLFKNRSIGAKTKRAANDDSSSGPAKKQAKRSDEEPVPPVASQGVLPTPLGRAKLVPRGRQPPEGTIGSSVNPVLGVRAMRNNSEKEQVGFVRSRTVALGSSSGSGSAKDPRLRPPAPVESPSRVFTTPIVPPPETVAQEPSKTKKRRAKRRQRKREQGPSPSQPRCTVCGSSGTLKVCDTCHSHYHPNCYYVFGICPGCRPELAIPVSCESEKVSSGPKSVDVEEAPLFPAPVHYSRPSSVLLEPIQCESEGKLSSGPKSVDIEENQSFSKVSSGPKSVDLEEVKVFVAPLLPAGPVRCEGEQSSGSKASSASGKASLLLRTGERRPTSLPWPVNAVTSPSVIPATANSVSEVVVVTQTAPEVPAPQPVVSSPSRSVTPTVVVSSTSASSGKSTKPLAPTTEVNLERTPPVPIESPSTKLREDRPPPPSYAAVAKSASNPPIFGAAPSPQLGSSAPSSAPTKLGNTPVVARDIDVVRSSMAAVLTPGKRKRGRVDQTRQPMSDAPPASTSTGSDEHTRQKARADLSTGVPDVPLVGNTRPPPLRTSSPMYPRLTLGKHDPPPAKRDPLPPVSGRPKREVAIETPCSFCHLRVYNLSTYCRRCGKPCHRDCKSQGHICFSCQPRVEQDPCVEKGSDHNHVPPSNAPIPSVPSPPKDILDTATNKRAPDPSKSKMAERPRPPEAPSRVSAATVDKPAPVIRCMTCARACGEMCKSCGTVQHSTCGLSRGECSKCRSQRSLDKCFTCNKVCDSYCSACLQPQHEACGMGGRGNICARCRTKAEYRHTSHKDWIPGEEMDENELLDALTVIAEVAAEFAPVGPLVHLIDHRAAAANLGKTYSALQLAPGDTVFMPFHLPSPGHFVALWWCPSDPKVLTYFEPLVADHPSLQQTLVTWRHKIAPHASLVRASKEVHMAGQPYGLLCGWCIVNDFLNIVSLRKGATEPHVPPDGLKSRELLENYARTALSRRVSRTKDAPKQSLKGKSRRARRAVDDRIQLDGLSPADDEGGPPNFRSGLLHLRRTGMEMEVAKKFAEPMGSLLQCTELRLPTDRTVLKGISFDQRKRHLYLLDTLMDVILRHHTQLEHLSLGMIWIKAIDLVQQERAWRSSGALLASASTLMGALDRLDQYTCLKPIRLSFLSEWRDAVKCWEKAALRVLPNVSAVTLAEVKDSLSHLSADAKTVMMIAWLHAARVGNVFTVKLKESEIRTVNGIHAWVITWTAAKTTPKVGAYTTHTAIPKEWLRELRALEVGRSPDDFLVHPKLEKSTVQEIRGVLRQMNPLHDMRSLRRGSLTAMALQGVDLETLLVYSGHRTVDMLLRYLQRGKVVQQRVQKGASAALKSLH